MYVNIKYTNERVYSPFARILKSREILVDGEGGLHLRKIKALGVLCSVTTQMFLAYLKDVLQGGVCWEIR